jgi:hypothetical protein
MILPFKVACAANFSVIQTAATSTALFDGVTIIWRLSGTPLSF